MNDAEERIVKRLTEVLRDLSVEIGGLKQQRTIELEWFKSHFNLATKHDLEEMEKRIMAESAEVKIKLQEAIASAKQTNIDIAEVQRVLDAQTIKIKELEDAIAAGGSGVPQEIADLAEEVRGLNKQADDALPNPVVVPPPV